jgi:uncharacterized protein YbjT (DUF2867 family)
MRPVLVTGATGTVGSHVVRELRDRGVPVRALVRGPDAASEGVEVVQGDFERPDTLRAALDGVDRVFLAAPNHPRQDLHETTLIDAAVAGGARRVVKLSAIGASPGSPVAFWDCHGRVEAHLRASGLEWAVLRASFYMTNLLAAADQVRDGRLLAPADGARIGMVDPRDVAAAGAALLTREALDPGVHVLTGPAAITYDDVAAVLSEVTGRPTEFVPVPDEDARRGMTAAGLPDWFAANLVALFGLLRRGAADGTSDGVRALTAREPRSFREFARDHAAAFSG